MRLIFGLVTFALSCVFSPSSGFNLDVENLVRHRGRPGSMFGFTVAQHSYKTQNWIIVGAPEDQTDQPRVNRGGAVYRCDVSSDNACEQIVFDRNGNNKDQEGNYIDSKSNQWFGATLTSSNGSVLACAPRYVYTQPTSTEERRDPVGTCWLARDQLRQAQEFSPCRNRDWGYHRHGYCQAGLGAALSKDGGRLYIGAPGSCYWQGSVHSVAATTKLPFVPPRVIIIQEGKIYSQNTHNRADVISTQESPMVDDDSYLGYSVTSGRFDGGLASPAPSDIVVGVPRSERLNGKVVLYTYNMTNIRNISGEQLGAYFGYSMAACDIDADGYDDLIVGAPMYTEEGNHDGSYETGRIYIFYAGLEDDRHVREGDKVSRARFGHSIACLGDVNRDGYIDIAVGAPYGKDGELGAVYIYHGSKIGIREKYSQVIKADEIPGNPLTFGFSVAGGIDMDRNQYPDLSVGAYESNQAFLFKARPVVQMFSTVTFDSESKLISLEERNCSLKDGSRVPCMKMDACLRYEGLGVDPRLDFDIQVLLDARKPKSPRLAFMSEEGRNVMNQTVRLDKGKTLCSSYWVYLKNNIRDKLTSLDAELWYSLAKSESARVTRSLTPVLDASEKLSAKDTLTIQKNCGRDNICIPDLRLIASPSVEKYVLGSGKRLEIEVEVQNEGEDAFESSFELQVPTGLNYVKIERKDESEREIPVQCSPPSFGNNYTLRCDIGNPLPKDKLVKFSVLLQPYQQKTMTPTYEFSMSVNSTNPEKNRTVSDNMVVFRVPIWVVTELAISGSSRPVDIYFNSSQYIVDESAAEITKESEIGPQVAHLYTITNKGPSEFLKARATILWPSNTLTGEPLLYLLEPPETSGNIECFVEYDEYNVRKLKIDRKGKSFFDTELGETGALSSSSSHEYESSSSSSGGSGSSSKSSSSWSSSSKSGGSRVELSKEERLKFEEDDRRREEEAIARETGDGSHRHSERAKARAKDSHHYSRNGGRLESDSYSRGSQTTIRERGRAEISRNPSANSKTYEEETYSSHSSSHSQSSNAGEVPITNSRSSERKTSTTWGRDGVGRTVSSWREEEDGIVRNGSAVFEHDSENRRRGGSRHGGTVHQTHERNSTHASSSRRRGQAGVGYNEFSEHGGSARGGSSSSTSSAGDRRVNWHLEGDGMTRNEDGTISTGDGTLKVGVRDGSAAGAGSSRRVHNSGAGGSRSSSEERRSEWNTTWSSEGRPVTSEHTSWRVEQDGKTVGSGANRRTFEGTADTSKAELENRLKEQLDRRLPLSTHSTSASNAELGHNLIGVGDKKYTKEWEEQYNTTWGSSTGGRPVTVAKTKWRIDEDGSVKSGGDTKTFEGVPPDLDNTKITIPSSQSNSQHQAEGSSLVASGSFESHHESSSHQSRAHSGRGGSASTDVISEGSLNEGRENDWRRVSTGISGIGRSSVVRTTEVREEERRRTSGRGGSRHGHTEENVNQEDNLHRSRSGHDGATVVETSRTITTQGGSERRRGHHFSTAEEGDDDSRTIAERRRIEAERRRTHHSSAGGEATIEESEEHRSHHHKTETSQSEAEGNARGNRQGGDARIESEHDRRTRLHGSLETTGSEELTRHEAESHRSRSSSSSGSETSHNERRQHGESRNQGSALHSSGTSSAASAVGVSSGASSSFDWGAVARGPGDGKARTYVSDLGILSGGSGNEAGRSISTNGEHSSSHHSSSAGAGADDVRRHHSASSRERHYSFDGGSRTQDSSADGYSGGLAESSSGSRTRMGSGGSETRYSSSRTYSSGDRNIEGDPDLDPDYESRRSGSSSSSSRSWNRSYSSKGGSSYGTVEDESSDGHRSITNPEDRQGFRHYRRERRYAEEYDNYGYDEYEEEESSQPRRCPGPVRCTRIICEIGALKKDQEVHVAVRSRLWVATIKKIAPHVETLVGSEMTAKVTLLPTIGRPSSKTMTKNSTEVKTRIMVEPVATPDVVPLWIVVLSAVSGALILMLLVYILYKLGFFKRNRPEPASTGSEKTPLNRNGHYQGDEHL